WHVAHDPNPTCIGIVLQSQPLTEEQELQGLLVGHCLRQALTPVRQRFGRAPGDVRLPGVPRRALVCLLECHEEGKVVKPCGMPGSKLCKGIGDLTMATQRYAPCRPGEELVLEGYHRAKRNLLRGETRDIAHLRWREQPVGDQQVGANQQRIPGKGREALVGRVAISRGTQRECLPQALLCSHQEIDEAIGLLAQIANAIAARQRGRMQQNATTTRKSHAGSSAERHLSHTGPLRWRPRLAYRFSNQETYVF